MNTNTQTDSTDRLLQLIAELRRRKAPQHLIENGDEAVRIDELITGITDCKVSPEVGKDPIERITTERHYVHPPRLTDANFVNYDRRCASVRDQPHSAVEELLVNVPETTDKARSMDVGQGV